MLTPKAAGSAGSGWRLLGYGLATLLAAFTYFYGLGSDHIPKNGDEFPYAHVTRITAGSGHLLPLRAEIESLRNTKPPLLFWQGIASTDWARNWELWRLRYPSVIYTLLTAGMVLLLASKLSGRRETGFLAILIFLAFFSTYRYGRPFLTDAPDVFWLFLPFFVLLYGESAAFESLWLVPVGLGLGIGVGLLYKSFALVVPVLLAIAWWYLHFRRYQVATVLKKDSLKIILMGCVSLALFSMWFVLDPDPRAIIKDFILKENAAKFGAQGGGYLSKLLWGGSSIWSLALGFPLDAGLLALPVAALFYLAYKRRAELSPAERRLWIWVIAFFFFFSLPSQRSERYLLPVMPGLAVLCALSWERINRILFVVSLIGGRRGVGTDRLSVLSAPTGCAREPAVWRGLLGITGGCGHLRDSGAL
jgi:4-amino-4-deoxy-L-arabinose transferase-like glycosyltransferase